MKDYYVLIHGARKNMGDFLIKDRTTALLRTYRPDRDIVPVPSGEPFEPILDKVNKEGMHALTDDERSFLKKASKKLGS